MQTLQKVMLLHLIYPTTNTSVPLLPDKKKSPRLQVLDTGMLNHFAGLQREIIGTEDLNAIYKGKVVEHMVGQEMLARQYNILNELHFWVREKTNATAEIDFIISYRSLLIPIEVKSGATGTLRSLHIFMDDAPHDIAIRLYGGMLKKDRIHTPKGKAFTLLSLPFYLAGRIENYVDWLMEG
jgi:predicted AAA+ superfamily ATPase